MKYRRAPATRDRPGTAPAHAIAHAPATCDRIIGWMPVQITGRIPGPDWEFCAALL